MWIKTWHLHQEKKISPTSFLCWPYLKTEDVKCTSKSLFTENRSKTDHRTGIRKGFNKKSIKVWTWSKPWWTPPLSSPIKVWTTIKIFLEFFPLTKILLNCIHLYFIVFHYIGMITHFLHKSRATNEKSYVLNRGSYLAVTPSPSMDQVHTLILFLLNPSPNGWGNKWGLDTITSHIQYIHFYHNG